MGESLLEKRKYSEDRVVITALDAPHPDSAKLGLPFELQGRGEANSETGEITIKYPCGDVFLSAVTAIHEAGHPRQGELNHGLHAGPQTGPDVAAEADAWQRGWQRFQKSNEDFLIKLDKKFLVHKHAGKLHEFGTFKDLYEWVRGGVGRIVDAQRTIYDVRGKEPREYGQEECEEFEALADMDAFKRLYESARVGEVINAEEFERELRKVVAGIISE